jgi:hypothetical protein
MVASSRRAATLLLIYILAPHKAAQVNSPLHLLWVSGHNMRDTLIPSGLKEESCNYFFYFSSYKVPTFLDWSLRLFLNFGIHWV